MNITKHFPSLLCILAVATPLNADWREWTNTEGKKIQAAQVRLEGNGVVLRLKDGSQALVPLGSLSKEDQAWAKAFAASAAAKADRDRLPWDLRRMPDKVKEPLLATMTIKVVKESPGSCVYDSGHFQFKTTAMLGTSVMKEVCAAFESTYELVSKLPWGIVPYPEEGRTKFQAELFESRKAYLATGAPDWSAGVYVRKDKVFRMPFEELGVSLFADPSVRSARPSGYSRNGLVNNLTITHEITHQMMHGYLPYVPAWFSEGTAEYTAHLPYDRGEFDVHGAVQAFKEIKGGGGKASKRSLFRQLSNNVGLISLASLWNCTKDMTGGSKDSVFASPSYYEELASRYYSAHALVFFFMHLDGDGKASRIKKYFDAIHEEKAAWAPYWTMVDAYNKEIEALRPEYEKYQRAMIEFMTLPGVEDLGGGRFKYPPNLSPPKPPVSPDAPKSPDGADPGNLPLKHLGILLDGRTVAQLDRELRDAFYKEGINL